MLNRIRPGVVTTDQSDAPSSPIWIESDTKFDVSRWIAIICRVHGSHSLFTIWNEYDLLDVMIDDQLVADKFIIDLEEGQPSKCAESSHCE